MLLHFKNTFHLTDLTTFETSVKTPKTAKLNKKIYTLSLFCKQRFLRLVEILRKLSNATSLPLFLKQRDLLRKATLN